MNPFDFLFKNRLQTNQGAIHFFFFLLCFNSDLKVLFTIYYYVLKEKIVLKNGFISKGN